MAAFRSDTELNTHTLVTPDWSVVHIDPEEWGADQNILPLEKAFTT